MVSAVLIAFVALLIWRCRKLRKEEEERKKPDHPYQRLLSVVSMAALAGKEEEEGGNIPRGSDRSSFFGKGKGKGRVGKGLADAVGQSLIEMRQVRGAQIDPLSPKASEWNIQWH